MPYSIMQLHILAQVIIILSFSSVVYGNVVCFSALAFFDPTFEPFLIEEVNIYVRVLF